MAGAFFITPAALPLGTACALVGLACLGAQTVYEEWDHITQNVGSAYDTAADFISKRYDVVRDGIGSSMDYVKSYAVGAYNAVSDLASNVASAISSGVSKLVSKLYNAATAVENTL